MMQVQSLHVVHDPADVGHARRLAVQIATRAGFDEVDRGQVALLVTEAASNMLKHAGSGEIVLGTFERQAVVGVEVLALDRGPGMADVDRCMEDGYSTAGSPGTGLGAIRRIASELDLHSLPGAGTALLARVVPRGSPVPREPGMQAGAVCLPVFGEPVPGDAWSAAISPERAVFMVADGLGHGVLAADAGREAVRIFEASSASAPEVIVENIHLALRATRGAAVAVAEVLPLKGLVRFCGLGNISAGTFTATGSRSFVSHNGTAGAEARTIQAFEYPWSMNLHLVMHSDGLTTRWDMASHPGLLGHDPTLIAAVLYRDHARRRDDVTVLVAREREHA